MILSNFPKKCMKSRKFWTVGGARAGCAPPKSATAKCKIQEAPPSSCHVIIIRLFPLRENKLGSATTKFTGPGGVPGPREVPGPGGGAWSRGGVPGPRGCLVWGGAWSWGGGAWPQGGAWSGVPGRDPSDGHCCGRYASYWNAFLFGE